MPDLKKIASQMSPKWSRPAGRFLLFILALIIKEAKIKHYLDKLSNYEGLTFIDSLLRLLKIEGEIYGLERVPAAGRLLFVANHPLGGIDALFLLRLIGDLYPDIKVLTHALLTHITPLQNLFVPLKSPFSPFSYIKSIEKLCAGNTPLLIFPAGVCSRQRQRKIVDLTWHDGFVRWAKKYNRLIVPIFFSGHNSMLFYKLANLREKLKIKDNIEKILLPREMFNKKGKRFNIYIGSPISTGQPTTKNINAELLAAEIRNNLYSLPADSAAASCRRFPIDYSPSAADCLKTAF